MSKIALIAVAATLAVVFYLFRLQKGSKGETAELKKLIFLKSRQWGVESALIRAIIKVESNFNPRARNPADPSYGLMQITPGLAADFGLIPDSLHPSNADIEKIYIESNNLDVGCWFLARLLNKYEFNEAIQMFNVGESGYLKGTRNKGYLDRVRKYHGKYGG